MCTQTAALSIQERKDWSPAIDEYFAGVPVKDICTTYGVTRRGLHIALDRRGAGRRGMPSGSSHPNWKGGRRLNTPTGYVRVWVDPSSIWAAMVPPSEKGSHVLEHRLVMAQSLGRVLTPDEHVHHRDGDRLNNNIDNLQLRRGPHGNGVSLKCAVCGSHDIIPQDI